MCDLYLGDVHSRATTPPNPFWTNPSIGGASTFVRGTDYPIPVTLQNADVGASAAHGCASSQVKLYWADPTTSFLLDAGHIIPVTSGQPAVQPIDGASQIPPSDSPVTFNFTFSPDASVVSAGPDPGHVCLLALGFCDSSECTAPEPALPGDHADPTNPRIAIRNVHVQDPTPPMKREWPFRTWPFFFGAAHGLTVAGRTRLVARAYDPAEEADRARILELAAMPGVSAALGPCTKFAVPAEVHLGVGVESVLVPPSSGRPGIAAPRLGYTGTVRPELARDLVRGAWTKATHGHGVAESVIELVPRQIRQAAVDVVPHGPDRSDSHAYAVEVRHELLTNGGPILMGGLTVIFHSPCRPW